MKSNYKRLGDYIRQVDVRNLDLAVTELRGLSMTKQFRESTSNIIGVDLSKYKIVNPGVFAFDTMSVIRVHRVPIILNDLGYSIIVSPAYVTFEVVDEDVLNKDFLFMIFKSSEFDRYADFKSDASVRGGYNWEELCDTFIPVPSIEEQRKIVAEYQAVERRIENNRRLITKLDETAQTIYRNMFVDNIDPENLPHGWRIGTIGEFCKETKSGGTPSRNNPNFWNKNEIRWLKSGEVANNVIFDTEEFISIEGLNGSSAKIIPSGSVIMAMYGATASQVAYLACDTSTNQACCNMITNTFDEAAYLYYHCLFKQEEIKRLANGGAQENLSQELICAQSIFLCDDKHIYDNFSKLLKSKITFSKEMFVLNELLTIILKNLSNF